MDFNALSDLTAISPLDGRYRKKVESLAQHWSEAALISARIRVEAHWLLHLNAIEGIGQTMGLSGEAVSLLNNLAEAVPTKMVQSVKEFEVTTNHDVKAVEYALRESLREVGCGENVLAFIHFSCTSEDINNTAYGLMLKESVEQVVLPSQKSILKKIADITRDTAAVPMLSRTHGQTASPTTLGKEMAVFGFRLAQQVKLLESLDPLAKFNGAVGNFNAHLSAYPELDWQGISKSFIEERLGLAFNPLTTQIESHDRLIEYCDHLRRWNTIAIDLSRDIWGYISLAYFGQKVNKNEVGSSTMPHKVNPIDFENAEGNYGLASSLCHHFADKLPISRWQRDLSDSTVQRSIGAAFGYHLLANHALMRGLHKLEPKSEVIVADLQKRFEVLAEPLQTVMRRYGIYDAYERVKAATRGLPVDEQVYFKIIDEQCDEIPADEKKRLKEMRPETYVGLAEQLAQQWCQDIADYLK